MFSEILNKAPRRADTCAWIRDNIPGFYRDPMKDHWGRPLIDATKPWERAAEFERKRIPGESAIRLDGYLQVRWLVSAARPASWVSGRFTTGRPSSAGGSPAHASPAEQRTASAAP